MDEQRISRMYVALAKERVMRIWYGVTGGGGRGASLFPLLAVVLVILLPGAIYVAHRHAKFHHLEEKIQGVQEAQAGPRPGGRDPIVLTRTVTAGAEGPEFASATLLPGLGMGVLQITAYLPGRGEVALLSAPTLQQMADTTFQPGGGINDVHGALEMPWSGGLEGLPSPIGMSLTEMWRGRQVTVPEDLGGKAGIAEGGMLKTRDADTASGRGGVATATYSATDFDEHWFGKTEATVDVAMEATSLVVTVRAKNVGEQAEPMGIGWHPRFAIVGGRRGEVTVKLPAAERLEYADKIKHAPTGKMGGGEAGFTGKGGELGEMGLDEGLVRMKGEAAAEMRDPVARFGVRVTGLSASIREMRVCAPVDQGYVSFGPQTNYDSPLSRVWAGEDGIGTLLPGQTMEWKVRVEVFGVAGR